MGTIVTIDVYQEAGTPTAAHRLTAAVGRARTALHRADDVFSTYRADSPMSRLRRGEALRAHHGNEFIVGSRLGVAEIGCTKQLERPPGKRLKQPLRSV